MFPASTKPVRLGVLKDILVRTSDNPRPLFQAQAQGERERERGLLAHSHKQLWNTTSHRHTWFNSIRIEDHSISGVKTSPKPENKLFMQQTTFQYRLISGAGATLVHFAVPPDFLKVMHLISCKLEPSPLPGHQIQL